MLLAEQIKTVAEGLSSFQEKFVFVGGSVVECYATSQVAEQARPTDDIDVVLELAHYGKYADLQEKLIRAGFNPDSSSKVICRYKYKEITVDIMPDEPRILGFSNRWYKDGIKSAVPFHVDSGTTIQIFSAPLYLAAKIEAYYHRGAKDKRLSSDFEDIVYVLENRPEVIEEVRSTNGDTQQYIGEFAAKMLAENDTDEAIGAVMGYAPMSGRISLLKMILNTLSDYNR